MTLKIFHSNNNDNNKGSMGKDSIFDDFGSKTFTRKITGEILEFYLSGEISSPDNYIEWFDAIRNAKYDDTVKIYINSSGGHMDTALQFLRVLSETNAEVVCSIEGACASAATIIFLAADTLEVTPNSLFMVHNYSSGAFGKGNEMVSQIMFERTWSEKLFNAVYKHFMSAQEIKDVLNGQDLWLDSDEVIIRCQVAMEEKEKEAKRLALTKKEEEDA